MEPEPRCVLHLDVPRFLASIERAIEPTLKTKAFAVVPTLAPRAPILDVSLEAWRDGVRKGMMLYEAQKVIPRLRFAQPHWGAARSAADALFALTSSFSPLVERAGHGHLYVDLTGHATASDRVLKAVREMDAFNCVLGVATNKLVSKVGTRAFKLRQPSGDGIVQVPPGGEQEFLSPLPVTLLPRLDRKITGVFDLLNIRLMQSLAGLDPTDAYAVIGAEGPTLVRQARGIDGAPVLSYTKSSDTITDKIAFSPDTNDWNLIRAKLYRVVERLVTILTGRREAARSLVLEVEYADLLRVRRSARLRPPTASTGALFDTASASLESAYTRRIRLRSLALELFGLMPAPTQIDLFAHVRKAKRLRLEGAAQAVRAKLGFDAIRVGASIPC